MLPTVPLLRPFGFTLLFALLAGCNAMRTANESAPAPNNSRSEYVARRADEMFKHGTPKDAALAKAESEWLNRSHAAPARGNSAQEKLELALEKISRPD